MAPTAQELAQADLVVTTYNITEDKFFNDCRLDLQEIVPVDPSTAFQILRTGSSRPWRQASGKQESS